MTDIESQFLHTINDNISEVKTDIGGLKKDIACLRTDIEVIRERTSALSNQVGEINNKACPHHAGIIERNLAQDNRLASLERKSYRHTNNVGASKKETMVIVGSITTIITSVIVGVIEMIKNRMGM